MTSNIDISISNFVEARNNEKLLFTAGPASLLPENLSGLRPCFGRGDHDYAKVETEVLDALMEMTGHGNIVRLQGSASLALEVMSLNYLFGKVLVVSTGYYSDRLLWLANSAKRQLGQITQIHQVDHQEMNTVVGNFDWVVACYTETSQGLKIPIESLDTLARRLGSKLMLDATASIGLEENHDLADVIAFSSCKGLFGLSGASFISYHDSHTVDVDSFYLKLETHINKLMTGPYHAICSLLDVLPRHDDFRIAVINNKKEFLKRYSKNLLRTLRFEPQLCTKVDCTIQSNDPRAILYEPRGAMGGSVICHLGEVHLGSEARGDILNYLQVVR
jgi:aspartate aminotransferase-like enzyme